MSDCGWNFPANAYIYTYDMKKIKENFFNVAKKISATTIDKNGCNNDLNSSTCIHCIYAFFFLHSYLANSYCPSHER